MKLSDLRLNRWLYRQSQQDMETSDAAFDAANIAPDFVPSLPTGGAAQDINTGNVFINGAQLEPGTIPQQVLDVSNWGWGQTCVFSSASAVQVNWGAGVFTSAGGDVYNISAGNTGTMSAKNYIYLDLNVSETAYQITTTPATAVGIGKVLIAVAQNGATSATFNLSEATQIVGDNILANSINASKIVAGSITATQMTAATINAMNIVAGSVAAENITGTTITGKIIQTATTGYNVVLGPSGYTDSIVFNNGATEISRIRTYNFPKGVGTEFTFGAYTSIYMGEHITYGESLNLSSLEIRLDGPVVIDGGYIEFNTLLGGATPSIPIGGFGFWYDSGSGDTYYVGRPSSGWYGTFDLTEIT